MKSVKEFSVVKKRILVRCDLNVPLAEDGSVQDNFKIKKSVETLRYLIAQHAKVIVMTHLGEPEGNFESSLTLDGVAKALAKCLEVPVKKVNDCIGPEVEAATRALEPSQVLLLENLRFHKEEIEGNLEFAKQLSFLGDLYVNDAFGVCHRNHASVTGIPQFLPSAAGFLLEREVSALDTLLRHPAKPMVVIVGGKKAETKSAFINDISKTCDWVLLGGLLAQELQEKNIQLFYPEKIISPKDHLDAPDISKETVGLFREKMLHAKTIIWNGPLGKFEDPLYQRGTLEVAKAIIDSGAYSVVGGGETVEFLDTQGILSKFSHVSTGGGAMLQYLSKEPFPGIDALNQKP